MSTEEILGLALQLSGFTRVPADSAVYRSGDELRRAMVAIDVGPAELLLARELGCDVAIAHHPAGPAAILGFPQVLDRHAEFLEAHGVPEAEAREAVRELKEEAHCRAHAAIMDGAVVAAECLGLAFMNIHLPLDEIGRQRMIQVVQSLRPEDSVGRLVESLRQGIPEFRLGPTEVELRVGRMDQPAGRVAVIHAAGTNGGYPVARALFEHGVGTVIYIHCSAQDSRRLREEYGDKGKNLIVTGHMAGDSAGINPFLDALEARGMDVVCLGGIVRASGPETGGSPMGRVSPTHRAR
jgi:hypothetical protein